MINCVLNWFGCGRYHWSVSYCYVTRYEAYGAGSAQFECRFRKMSVWRLAGVKVALKKHLEKKEILVRDLAIINFQRLAA